MRPGLGSRSLRQMPPIRRAVVVVPPRRGGAAGCGGTSRSRLPLWHRVALRTLPRLLIFPMQDKSPARAGLFLFSPNNPGGDLPVVATTTPVAAAPTTAAMPAPMPATPTAAAPTPVPAAPAAMTAAAPAHFLRREAIDLLARRDGGLDIGIDGQFGVGERRRHQRRGLRARCKRDAARGKSKGEFQKVARSITSPPPSAVCEKESFELPR